MGAASEGLLKSAKDVSSLSLTLDNSAFVLNTLSFPYLLIINGKLPVNVFFHLLYMCTARMYEASQFVTNCASDSDLPGRNLSF